MLEAQRAGAIWVLVINDVPDRERDGGLVEMGGDGGRSNPAIPAVLVPHSAGVSIRCACGADYVLLLSFTRLPLTSKLYALYVSPCPCFSPALN